MILCLTGTAFVFSCFVYTYSGVVLYPSFGQNLARFNIIWALISSIVGAYAGSALFGKGEIGFKEVLVGTISGGVIIGSCAPVAHNIGIVMAIGGVAGLISGIWYRVVNKYINKEYVFDSMGMFGSFFISSLLGSLLITPVVLAWYSNIGEVSTGTGYVIPQSLVGWQLIYVAISIAIGVAGGLVAGLLCFFDKDYFGLASNLRIFSNSFGLFDDK